MQYDYVTANRIKKLRKQQNTDEIPKMRQQRFVFGSPVICNFKPSIFKTECNAKNTRENQFSFQVTNMILCWTLH